ncbi:hypothetical protein L1887_03080 [Cichorium endivia]|nr:hypothetical protein L1887_03080 [Cichorium endivia]
MYSTHLKRSLVGLMGVAIEIHGWRDALVSLVEDGIVFNGMNSIIDVSLVLVCCLRVIRKETAKTLHGMEALLFRPQVRNPLIMCVAILNMFPANGWE